MNLQSKYNSLIVAYIYILDTYRRNDNRCSYKRRKKTSLQLYLPLTLFVRVRKGCSRFACERVLETEHKLHILTSTTYDRHVVSFLFS